MIKNILYVSGSIVIFFAGMILYGVLLNTREVSLSEAMQEKNITGLDSIKLVVHRKNYKIELYSGKVLIKTYNAAFGKNSSVNKTSRYDNVTPLGDYRICGIETNSRFHKNIKLNYPNMKDAGEALTRGYINQAEFKMIAEVADKNICPPADTRLGADIGIHGIGKYDIIFRNLPFTFNWTGGSIAVNNRSIDELVSIVKIGTPVKITY